MITEERQKAIAEAIVGEGVVPFLYSITGNSMKVRGLPKDRFSLDDDGYYLVNAGLRVPTCAILESHYSGEHGLILSLEECYVERRRLVRELAWH